VNSRIIPKCFISNPSIFLIILIVLIFPCLRVSAEATGKETGTKEIEISEDRPVFSAFKTPECNSAIVMEASTGEIVYSLEPATPFPPASMVKIMVIFLTLEKIKDGEIHLDDIVTTSARASGMGGSQVYLKHGETFALEELLKAVIIQSANDASIAIAEHISGSVEAFVDLMNYKAGKLGMKNSIYHTPHGLPPGKEQEPDMVSAHDLAILTRALMMEFPEVLKWSRMEQEEFRDGKFLMTNTNKLIKKYSGCDGLKTGYYRNAGFSVTATAQRKGIRMIAVIMGCKNSRTRFGEASRLLSLGFNQYDEFELIQNGVSASKPIQIINGVKKELYPVTQSNLTAIIRKDTETEIVKKTVFLGDLTAPVTKGTVCGSIVFMLGERNLGEVQLIASEDIEKLGLWGKMLRIIGFE